MELRGTVIDLAGSMKDELNVALDATTDKRNP
jgi:hypothetical protein